MPPRYDAYGEPIVEAPRPRPRQMRPVADRLEDPNPGVRRQARDQSRSGARYDTNGEPITPAPFTADETFEDVARSIPAGVQRGIAATIGQRGDISELRENLRESIDLPALGDAINEYGQMVIDPLYAVERAVGAVTGTRPTSSTQVNEAIESAAGEQYEPQTTAGEYARTFGEFLPTALIPAQRASRVATNAVERGAQLAAGSVRNVATQAAAPALASEALGQVTEGTDAEGPARLVGALLGAGVSEASLNILTRQGLTPDERAIRLIRRELANAGYAPEEITRVANRLLAQAPTEEVLGELMGPSGRRLMRATAAMGQGSGRSAAETVFESRAIGRPGPHNSQDETRRGVSSVQERVLGEAARTFEPEQTRAPNNYWDALMTLRRARRAQSANDYTAAYDAEMTNEDVQDYIMPALQNASVEALTSGAAQLASQERRLLAELNRLTRQSTQAGRNGVEVSEEALRRVQRIQRDIEDVRAARGQLEGFAAAREPPTTGNARRDIEDLPAPPTTVNARALDYYNRGLRQLERTRGPGTPEGASYGDEAREFRNLVQEVNPALAQAIGNFASSKRVQEFMQAGRRVFDMSDGELDRVLQGDLMAGEADNILGNRALTTEEFDGFQLGVLDAFEQKLGANSTGFLARLMRNRNWLGNLIRSTGAEATDAAVTNLLNGRGPPEARRFINRLTRELGMQRTRNEVLSGSRTTPLSEDIAALTTGESEFSFLADAGGVQNFVSRVSAGARNPFDAGIRVATWIWDRYNRPGIANPEVQAAMARRLFSRVTRDSSQELRDALLAIPENPNVHPELRTFVRGLIAVNGGDEEPETDDVQ